MVQPPYLYVVRVVTPAVFGIEVDHTIFFRTEPPNSGLVEDERR